MADANKDRVIVLAVGEGGLSATEAARRFGVTRPWIHRLLARYRTDGLDAGAESIRDRLTRQGLTPLAASAVHWTVRAAGRATPEPQRRPRSSWQCLQAATAPRLTATRLTTMRNRVG